MKGRRDSRSEIARRALSRALELTALPMFGAARAVLYPWIPGSRSGQACRLAGLRIRHCPSSIRLVSTPFVPSLSRDFRGSLLARAVARPVISTVAALPWLVPAEAVLCSTLRGILVRVPPIIASPRGEDACRAVKTTHARGLQHRARTFFDDARTKRNRAR